MSRALGYFVKNVLSFFTLWRSEAFMFSLMEFEHEVGRSVLGYQ